MTNYVERMRFEAIKQTLRINKHQKIKNTTPAVNLMFRVYTYLHVIEK